MVCSVIGTAGDPCEGENDMMLPIGAPGCPLPTLQYAVAMAQVTRRALRSLILELRIITNTTYGITSGSRPMKGLGLVSLSGGSPILRSGAAIGWWLWNTALITDGRVI